MFCQNCHYDLRALGNEKRCPECGRQFRPGDPDTYLVELPKPKSLAYKITFAIRILIILLIVSFIARCTHIMVLSSKHW